MCRRATLLKSDFGRDVSSEFYDIFHKNFFIGHLQTAASTRTKKKFFHIPLQCLIKFDRRSCNQVGF